MGAEQEEHEGDEGDEEHNKKGLGDGVELLLHVVASEKNQGDEDTGIPAQVCVDRFSCDEQSDG